MSYRLRSVSVVALLLAGSAWTAGQALACKVVCQGLACGGPGPNRYLYQVTASTGLSMDHWQLGVHDTNPANYINWTLPPGWGYGFTATALVQDDGFTAHGVVSAPTGTCPAYINFSGPAITGGTFGFDHPGAPHDVGWCVYHVGIIAPCIEDWTQPVGMGAGPAHGPLAVPQPPVCCFTYSPPNPSAGATVQFTDCSTDPDDLIISWSWAFGDGATSAQQHPTHVFAAGVYVVFLTVTDQAGNTTTCAQTITVSGPYCQVVCQGLPCGGPGPTRFLYQLTASGSYTFDQWSVGTYDPYLSKYTNWVVPPGWTYTITAAGMFSAYTGYTPHTMFSVPNSTCPYEIVFAGPAISTGVFGFDNPSAFNDVGWQVQDTTAPWQYSANWLSPVGTGHGPVHAPGFSNFWPPVCSFTYAPSNPNDQTTVQFTDTSYDLGDQIVAWAWNFGDGGTSAQQNPSHQFAAGTYTVSLTVTDDGAPPLSSTCSQTLTVTMSNINPSCRFTYTPGNPSSAAPVQFIDQSVDPDGWIAAWAWDFQSDGIIDSNLQNPTWTYPPGRYNASLAVTDNGTPPRTAICMSAPIFVSGPSAQVFCECPTVCPGGSPTWYQYYVVAPTGETFDQLWVGTDDPNPANYTPGMMPPGWWWWLLGPHLVPHDPCTNHGVVTGWTGYCPNTLLFMGPPLARGRFAFRHPSPAHDVGWLVVDSVPVVGSWIENWAMPLGLGQGPVHGPGPTPNLPPSCNPTVDCSGCMAGQPLQFHANAVDPEGGPMTYEWDFGDGSIGAPGSDPFHEFVYSDTYEVCLRVTDSEGAQATCCVRIGVGPGQELCFPMILAGNCWHLITLPCYPVDTDPAAVFDELLPPNKPFDYLSGQLHRYDTEEQRYATYYSFFPSDFGPIKPGEGYWLWLFEDEVICYEAVCSGEMEEVHYPDSGWYLTGSPQPTDTHLDCTLFHRGAGPLYRFSEIMNEWVMDPLVGYYCQEGRYDYTGLLETDEYEHLQAFKGYWLYTFQPIVTMSVPPDPCCPPVCCFEFLPPEPDDQTPVQFIDCSWDPDGHNIVGWEWDFDNDGTVDSTEQNPVHVFECDSYVCLTITDDDCPPGADQGYSECCQVVTVIDTTPPAITCPEDVVVCNDPGTCEGHDIDIGSTIIADACDPDPAVTNNAPEYFPVGTTIVTWTACDESGNCSSCDQLVTVLDCEPPVLECPPEVEVGTDPGQCYATLDWDMFTAYLMTATDNCGPGLTPKPECTWEKTGQSFTLEGKTYYLWVHWGPDGQISEMQAFEEGQAPPAPPPPGPVLQLGSTPFTLGVCDEAGNCTTCDMMITVVDCEPPTFECPPDLTLESPECEEIGLDHDLVLPYLWGVSDNCAAPENSHDGDPDVDCDWDFVAKGHYSNRERPKYCRNFNVWIHWKDGEQDGSADIDDGLTPTSGVPPTITGQPSHPAKPECTWECVGWMWIRGLPGVVRFLWIHWGAGGQMDQYQWLEVGEKPNPQAAERVAGIPLDLGENWIEWTVRDEAGNWSQPCVQTVTVLCPPECCFSYDPPVPNNGTPVQFMDCSSDPDGGVVGWEWDFGDGDMGVEPSPFHWYECGTYEVCLTVTDDDGLSDTCCTTITVVDVIPPDIICMPYEPVCGVDGQTYPCGEATVTDSCDPDPVVVQDPPPGTPLVPGEYTIVVDACDASGNCSHAECPFTVVDCTPPVITCPSEATLCNDPGLCEACGPDIGMATATDDWDPAPVITNDAPPCLPVGTTPVTWTACDSYGNCSSCEQTVTVQDCEPPTMPCPQDMTLISEDCEPITIDWLALAPELEQATDNCTELLSLDFGFHEMFPGGHPWYCLICGCHLDAPGEFACDCPWSEDPVEDALLVPGVNQMEWWVCDEAGNCSEPCVQTVTVDCPPVADPNGPYEVECNSPVPLDLDGSGSYDPNAPLDSIVAWEWDINGDGVYGDRSGETVAVTWPEIEAEICGGTCDLGTPYPIRLEVIDTYGATGSAETTLTIYGSEPVADPNGPYEIECESPVPLELDGSGSYDPDDSCGDSIVTWDWDINGDGVYGDRTGETVPITWPEIEAEMCDGTCDPGTPYPVALRVTDSHGASSTASTTVTVYNSNPVADANGPYHVPCEGDEVILDGSGSSDPDDRCGDSIVAWDWDINGDGVYGDRTGEIVPLTWPEIETEVCGGSCLLDTPYLIAVRVNDSHGAVCAATTTLTLTNSAPIADPNGPYELPAGEGLTLDGSGSVDPDMGCGDSIVAWDWDINGDGVYGDRSGETVPMTWPEIELEVCDGSCLPATPYPVALRVTDSYGATGSAATTITVLLPPECCFSYDPPDPDTETLVQFLDCSHDPDGAVVGWQWDFDGDGLIDSEEANPTHNFELAGTYDTCLTVTDNDGMLTICCQSIEVLPGNLPPECCIDGPTTGYVGEELCWTSCSTDPDGTIVAYLWDFGEPPINWKPDGGFETGFYTPGAWPCGMKDQGVLGNGWQPWVDGDCAWMGPYTYADGAPEVCEGAHSQSAHYDTGSRGWYNQVSLEPGRTYLLTGCIRIDSDATWWAEFGCSDADPPVPGGGCTSPDDPFPLDPWLWKSDGWGVGPPPYTWYNLGPYQVTPTGNLLIVWYKFGNSGSASIGYADGVTLIEMPELVTTETACHTYSSEGTYDVCLTVTDDDGESSTCCEPVVVTAAPPTCQVVCNGAVCGGTAANMYQYQVTTSPGAPFDHFYVGTHDPALGNYGNWDMPTGWAVDVVPGDHLDDGYNPHGLISMPTGMCPFSLVFSGMPVEFAVFGFDHPGEPHDVGWRVNCQGFACSIPSPSCVEDWTMPLGMDQGPVHGPIW